MTPAKLTVAACMALVRTTRPALWRRIQREATAKVRDLQRAKRGGR